MMTYYEAQTIFNTAKVPKNGKPLGNNTRLYKGRSNNYEIQSWPFLPSYSHPRQPIEYKGKASNYEVVLHQTPVVIIYRDHYVLNSGGWKTVTTKQRINQYSPARVYSEKGTWFVGGSDCLFYDSMKINLDGTPMKPKSPGTMLYYQKKLRKLVSSYVKDFCDLIEQGKLTEPSGGDCWLCLTRIVGSGSGVEIHSNDVGHIISHLEEKYLVPGLLVNAFKGNRNGGYQWSRTLKGDSDFARRALNKYFNTRKEALMIGLGYDG